MSRETLVHLMRRTMSHSLAGTVPQADGIREFPAKNYVDSQRWELEMERIFKRVPLTLGFSCELSEPGSYQAFEVAGVPVLLSRDQEGVIRSFVNSCSHRGAVIMEEGTGTARRFTCPYHGWSYNQQGALVGILDRRDFGDQLDPSCHGLQELPCEERAGLIFGSLTPGSALDLDQYLLGYDQLLEHLHLADCTLVGRQQVDGPNWKVAYDGYVDLYHLPILHKETFGPDYNNKAIYDAWGPHQHVSSPDERVLKYQDTAEDDWPELMLTAGLWTIFPHVSIARFDAGGPIYMVSQLFPGDTPGSSVTVQSFLSTFDPDDEQNKTIATQMDFLLHVVRDEDYFTGFRLQKALKAGIKSHVMFGRNEAGGQRFHRWIEDLVGAETDADYRAVLAKSEVVFQT